jgi:hypothetical protein
MHVVALCTADVIGLEPVGNSKSQIAVGEWQYMYNYSMLILLSLGLSDGSRDIFENLMFGGSEDGVATLNM